MRSGCWPSKLGPALLGLCVCYPLGANAQTESDSPWLFRLDLIATWDFAQPDIPVAASASDSTLIALVTQDRQRIKLLSGEETILISGFGASPIDAILFVGREIWVGAGRALFTVEAASGSVQERHRFDSEGRVSSIACSKGRIWVTFVDGNRGSLFEMKLSRGGRLARIGDRALPNGHTVVYSFTDRSVLLQQRAHPYGANVVWEGMVEGRSFVPTGESFARFAPDTTRWLVGAAMRFSEDALLQWFVDTRSIQRAAVVSSIRDSTVERVTRFDSPIGFVHSFRKGETGYVLGAQEIPDGRRLILYRIIPHP